MKKKIMVLLISICCVINAEAQLTEVQNNSKGQRIASGRKQ